MRPNEKNKEKECGQTKKTLSNMRPNEKNETICSQTKKTKQYVAKRKKRRKRIVQKPSKNVVIYSNTDENKN